MAATAKRIKSGVTSNGRFEMWKIVYDTDATVAINTALQCVQCLSGGKVGAGGTLELPSLSGGTTSEEYVRVAASGIINLVVSGASTDTFLVKLEGF